MLPGHPEITRRLSVSSAVWREPLASAQRRSRRRPPKRMSSCAVPLFPTNPTQPTMKMHRLRTTTASLAGFLTVVLNSSRPKARYSFSENLSS